LDYAGSGQAERTSAGGTTARNGLLGVEAETTGGQETVYRRDAGGGLVLIDGPSIDDYYFYFDGLGSVIGLVDPSGNQRATYSYDPFGSHATASPVNGLLPTNPWRWMGGYLDSTGLYHFGERYYQPATGRFLQVDPIAGGSANAYGYCSGDPINCSDLSGMVSMRDFLKGANRISGHVATATSFVSVVCPVCIPVSGFIATAATVVNIGSAGIMTFDDCFVTKKGSCTRSVVGFAGGLVLNRVPVKLKTSLGGDASAVVKYGGGEQMIRDFEFGTNVAGSVLDSTAF
jgi:RHS repeat-associated protein